MFSAGEGKSLPIYFIFMPSYWKGYDDSVTFDDDENRWTFSPDDDEDDDADPDAVWCESDWPSSVGARVFREASATTEWAALVAGAAVTSLAVLLTNRLDAVARARFKEE